MILFVVFLFRVITLMSKIGGLCAEAVHPSIDACLDSWVEAIQEAEVKRREELLSFGSRRRQQDDNEELAEHKGSNILLLMQNCDISYYFQNSCQRVSSK